MGDAIPAAIAVIGVVYLLFSLVLSLAVYVFSSLGYYTIAKRRGIPKPWLAFIPVGNQWILGSISDQYQLAASYKTRHKSSQLLWLNAAAAILLIVFMISLVVTVLSALAVDPTYSGFIDVWQPVRRNLADMLWAYLVTMAVSIALTVVQYVALYDLYRSCDPENSVLFLLLSIFLGIGAFLVFACRKKDLGMPPVGPWNQTKM